jgi:hypothetical protein
VDQLDEVVALFDQAVSARESRAKSRNSISSVTPRRPTSVTRRSRCS